MQDKLCPQQDTFMEDKLCPQQDTLMEDKLCPQQDTMIMQESFDLITKLNIADTNTEDININQ